MAFDHQRKFTPSRKAQLLFTALGLGCLLLGLVLPNNLLGVNITLFASLGLLTVVDWRWAHRQPPITVVRNAPTGLALNRWSEITLVFHHNFSQPIEVEFFDGLPNHAKAEGHNSSAPLRPKQVTQHIYRLRPLQRGPLDFTCCYVKVTSPLGLWQVQYRTQTPSSSKVYPDFSAIAAYTILATENHMSQVGIRRKNRRGQGLDFHQLRNYRQGDSLRQLDWKATARRQELISKDYQDERDQNVILMIDSGRRMRCKDDELDHFDHALNASLLISYIALRQGDSVGVLSFGNGERWIAPQKGSDRVNAILNGLYDLQTSNCAPDYLMAAEKVTQLQRKRSLVILVTNSRDEELDELSLAVNQLKKRHVVLIANIREQILDNTLHTPISNFDQALSYCGTVEFVNQRQKVQKMLNSKGLYAVDCLAKELPIQLANSYWDIKRAGLL